MKLVVVSDNHGDAVILKDIINKYQGQNVHFLHCGDSEMPSKQLQDYISVRGNNDTDSLYPNSLVVELDTFKIYITHGHKELNFGSKYKLLLKAKEQGCNLVLFGHTHIFESNQVDGITLVNPGSLHYNRDGTNPSYAVIEALNGVISVKRVNVSKKW